MPSVPAEPIGRPSLRALALATHLGPTLAVTAVGTLLSLVAGAAPWRVVVVGSAVLAGQASIGWSNDWLDADRDRAVARPDKPVVQGAVTPALLRTAALAAVLVAAPLSLALGLRAGALLLLLVLSGWAYNAGLKRTAASALPYVVGFGALPAGAVAAAQGAPVAPWWLVAAGGGLGAAAHLANVAPDLADDLATGVRGLPHRLGAVPSAAVCALLLGGVSVLLVVGPAGPPTPTGWIGLGLAAPVVALAALAGSPRWRRYAFPAVLVLTVLDVGLLLVGGAALA